MKKRGRVDSTASENSLTEESNDPQSKILNNNESDKDKNKTNDLSALNMNNDQSTNKKNHQKNDIVSFVGEANGSSTFARRTSQRKILNQNESHEEKNKTNDVLDLNINNDQTTNEESHQKNDVTFAGEASGSTTRASRRSRSKILNKNESDEGKNKSNDLSALNMSNDQSTIKKSHQKNNIVTSTAEASGSSTRSRGRSQSKILNTNESDEEKNKTNNLLPVNMNNYQSKNEKIHQKNEVITFVGEGSGSSTPLRRRSNPASYCPQQPPSPDSRPISSAKKMKIKKTKVEKRLSGDDDEIDSRDSNISKKHEDSSDDKSNGMGIASTAALCLDKLKFDIQIDPNVVDRYTDSGFTAEGSTPESPETRRQRIDIISRQCRLHPANKKYNQGPVENPPLITPAKRVGYTPGGQRHEVDLNVERPTWFNSEYARMQWDCATKVNVSRMFHQLETGTFLPDGLDPNIERRYFAERDMVTKQANEYFEEIANVSSSHANGEPVFPAPTEEDKEHFKLIEAENELIELNKFIVLRFQDFVGEVEEKLRNALKLPLTPLMIKKNPVILDTLEKLSTQCIHLNVVLAARALLDKIKGLFQVPENQEFRQFFAEEVEKLKEKTKDMSGIDIIMMTEEPTDETDDTDGLADTVSESNHSEGEEDPGESEEDEWVPVENGDRWVDSSPDSTFTSLLSSNEVDFYSDLSEGSQDVDGWTSNDENEDSDSSSHVADDLEDLESYFDDLQETLISEE